jgi:hypothetical protein
MHNRLLWTICQLIIILINVNAGKNSSFYMERISRIEDGLKRLDQEIFEQDGV